MGDVEAVLIGPDGIPHFVHIPRDANDSLLDGFLQVLKTDAIDVIELSDRVDLWVEASWRSGQPLNMAATAALQAFSPLPRHVIPVHGAALFTGPPDEHGETQLLSKPSLATVLHVLAVVEQVSHASDVDA